MVNAPKTKNVWAGSGNVAGNTNPSLRVPQQNRQWQKLRVSIVFTQNVSCQIAQFIVDLIDKLYNTTFVDICFTGEIKHNYY